MSKLPPSLLAKGLPILIFVLPFAVNYGFIIDHFYDCQASISDSGLMATLAWRNTWALHPPTVLGWGSFLQAHVFGIFWLTSALSYILPLNMVQSYALYQGLYYALPAVTLYSFLLAQFPGLQQGWQRGWAAFLSLLFAFNGITQVLMDDTHPEIAGPTFLILFLTLWVRQRYGWAIVPFLLCLLVREDMGFHIVGILGLVLLGRGLSHRGFWQQPAGRWLWGFNLFAFTYSIGIIVLQKIFAPEVYDQGYPLFAGVYLGDPAFAHLSAAFFRERLADQLRNLHYIYLPALATLSLSLYPRWRPTLLIGFLAYLPWYGLHLLAVKGIAGILAKYYTFPYIISLAWPLVWPWMSHTNPTPSTQRWGVKVFTVGVVLSILGAALSPNVRTVDLSHFKRSANISAFNAITAAAHVQDDWGQVYIDESIEVLLPREFEQEAWLTHADHESLQPADNLLYCEPSLKPEGVEALLRSQSFKSHYRLKDTPLRLQTNWALTEFEPQWAEVLEPIEQ
ncbi:MAG: hypothetical protein AAGG51_08955 [Cyanobacteria bacterium P01_G01_bin.54]